MPFSPFPLVFRDSGLHKDPPHKCREDNSVVTSQGYGVSWSKELGKDFPKDLSISRKTRKCQGMVNKWESQAPFGSKVKGLVYN